MPDQETAGPLASTPGLPGVYHRRSPMREVVAGLVNDGSADAVARAAVEEAAMRQCAVRFVQVLPESSTAPDADERTFAAAMHALARHSRVRATFEVVGGDPVAVLVSRTTGASVLVLGEDQLGAFPAIAAAAQRKAQCPVRLIPLPGNHH
ncbi:hypothetical protein V3N99_13425 [Dermatophilaceae bacterium Soc4.6]